MKRGNTAVVVGSHQVARKEPRVWDEQLHEVVYTLVPASGCLAGCIEVVMIDHQSVFARRRYHVGQCKPAILPRWDRAMGERVLFIGTQFSILYTSMYSPAEAATPRA